MTVLAWFKAQGIVQDFNIFMDLFQAGFWNEARCNIEIKVSGCETKVTCNGTEIFCK